MTDAIKNLRMAEFLFFHDLSLKGIERPRTGVVPDATAEITGRPVQAYRASWADWNFNIRR
jgi:hypothetical protein